MIYPGIIILMGVSGCGKTTVGQQLADGLGWDFLDADDVHPSENIAKMFSGIPLDDDDRRDWLAALAIRIHQHLQKQRPLILACSALKQAYRNILQIDEQRVCFVYLKGTRPLIQGRLQFRQGHFMQTHLLESQFAALEEPIDAFTLDIVAPPEQLVADILATVIGNRT